MTIRAASEPQMQDDVDGVYSRCTLHDADSIRVHLQQLINKRCTLTAYVDAGAVSMLTAPLAIEANILVIDVPPSAEVLERFLQSPRISFVGVLDKVTLRFGCGPPALCAHGGRPALSLPLPHHLLHLQRRELMRREPPPNVLRCLVLARGPAVGGPPIPAVIHDIGGGGLALLTPMDALALDPGDLLPGCVIELPGLGSVRVTLRVCHVRQLRQRSKDVYQAGCQFVDLAPATQAKLFRYLMQLDRDQVARQRERSPGTGT